MDEMNSIKQALSFLLEQESIRQQEIAALNEKIDSLLGTVNDRVKEFSGWVNDRDFKDFSDKYGERLAPYADKMNKIHTEDGYDFMKDLYNSYDGKQPQDDFINETVEALDKYLEEIGIPKDVKVEVKADLNGDGEVETVVDTNEATPAKAEPEAEVKKEVEVEEPAKAETEDEDKEFMDSINKAVDKELAKNK